MKIDNKLKFGFVFTNFNNSQVTLDAIKSLSTNNMRFSNRIIIVDNKSDDYNVNLLKGIENSFANVSVIYNNENVGYFKGLNEGIKLLRNQESKFENIIVGNNDLIFPLNFIESIINKSELTETYPVISPNIITMDGIHQNPHVINKISAFRELVFDLYHANYFFAKIIKKISKATKSFTDRKDEEQHELAQTIYQGYGACYILTPVFFKYFDELWAPTFLMGEEFFLSKQIESKEFRVFYEPSIIVNHQCHATMDKMPQKKIWEYAKESHSVYRKYVGIWN